MQRTKATATQINYLVEYMKENPVCAAGRADGLQGKVELEKQWKHLVSILNSLGGPVKTEEKWKQTWRDFRNTVKKKALKIKKEVKEDGPGCTGNGQAQLEVFTAQDEPPSPSTREPSVSPGMPTSLSMRSPTSTPQRKRSQSTDTKRPLERNNHITNNTDDEVTAFGNYVAAQMRKLRPIQQSKLKLDIQTLMCKYEIENIEYGRTD